MMQFVLVCILALSIATTTAHAETITYSFKKYSHGSGSYFQDGPLLKPIKGALTWDVFATTTENGQYPVFTDMNAHDGETITLYGYIFTMFPKYPLSHFMLGPYPPTCAFHYHVRKNLIVEVIPTTAMTYSEKPVLIKGTLKLVRDNSRYTYYLLQQAELVK